MIVKPAPILEEPIPPDHAQQARHDRRSPAASICNVW
jgi:hypothetical protein